MALSAALKAALQSQRPGADWVLELDVPGGIRRYSVAGYSSLGRGHYEGKVLSWGTVGRSPSAAGGTLPAAQTAVEIEDTSREWARLVEAGSGDLVRGSAATIYLAHPDVAFADWSAVFVGEIARNPWPGPLRTSLVLRASDRPLRSKVPRPAWAIQGVEFPAADPEVYDQFAALIYGVHNSITTTEAGMVPAPRVGAGEYLLSAGWVKDVMRCYEDGSESLPTAWAVAHPIIGGKQYTRIDYVADPGADVVITADVQGYEVTGDGSGALIEDPLDQLSHLISNWVVGDYRSGNWLATNAIIDAASFASTFFSDRNYSGSFRVAAQRDGFEIVKSWAESHEARAWWTTAGTLAVGVEDPTMTAIYQDDPWLRWERHALTPFKLAAQDSELTSDLLIHYVYGSAADQYLQAFELAEPNAPAASPLAYNQPWSSAQ